MTDILKRRKDVEREIDGEVSRISAIIASKVYDAMDAQKISKIELAERVRIPLDYLSGMLDGELPITIKMMVRFSTALGFKWDLGILDESYSRPAAPKLKGIMKAH